MRTITIIVISMLLAACNNTPATDVGATAITSQKATIQNAAYLYKGSVVNGEPEGEGRFDYVWGDVYEGKIKKGLPNGKGIMHYANGDIYIGTFVEGQKSGKGKINRTDGSSYEGEWCSDYESGQGLLVHGNMQVKGLFKHGEPVEGKVIVEDTSYCSAGNCTNGEGIYDYGNRHYEGSFSNGLFEGYGHLKVDALLEYEGYFKQGMFHGKGVFKNTEAVIEGYFINGKWVSGIKRYYDGRPDLHLMKGE